MAIFYGRVLNIRHQTDGFVVFQMSVEEADPSTRLKTVTISGPLCGLAQVKVGVSLGIIGEWTEHPKYGKQVQPFGWRPYARTTPDVERFLSTCLTDFGSMASFLTERFGIRTYEKLTSEPDELRALFGADDPKRLQIDAAITAWQTACSVSMLSIFLQDYNISSSLVKLVFETFGLDAIQVVTQNPYRLLSVEGFTFSRADQVARRVGVGAQDLRRIEGAILWLLRQESQEGHLYVRRGDLPELFDNMMQQECIEPFEVEDFPKALDEAVTRLVDSKSVMLDPRAGIYLPALFRFEREGARKLAGFVRPTRMDIDLDKFLAEYEKGHALQLSEAQREGVRLLVENRVLVLTGLPGTGKTKLVQTFVDLFKATSTSYLLMAPTGIAAKHLANVTGSDAATVHRTFGYHGDSWRYNQYNKYPIGAVICDEMCLPYRQFVDLADGTRRYIGTIVNKKQPIEVLSYNPITGQPESRKVTGWFKYPASSEPLYEFRCSLANSRHRQRILRCTGKHKVYVSPGEQRRALTLQVGDRVMVKGTFLNPTQRSFLMGSLLGDACLGGKPSGRRVQFSHGQAQEMYLRFKAALFRCAEPYPNAEGYNKKKKVWQCYSPIIDDLDEVYPLVYPEGTKTVTREWLDQVDPIGLAAWYMDDGSLSTQTGSYPAAILHTEGFDHDQCVLLKEWLQQKWAIKASVYSDGQRGHFFLRLTCASSKTFWTLIAPWIHPTLAYKLPRGMVSGAAVGGLSEHPYLNTSGYPIQAVRRFCVRDNLRKFVYDIEVEGNHNYFSNDTLVSNSMVDMELFYRLLDALHPSTMLVLVGDDAQLPSVGPGNVLRELLTCKTIPHVRLTQIFRQAHRSEIVLASHQINRGETLMLGARPAESDFQFVACQDEATLCDLIVKMAVRLKSRNANFQVLAPKYDGVVGVNHLNLSLREALNPDVGNAEWKAGKIHFRFGDRVLITKNDYKLNVYNGDLGKIREIRRDEVVVGIHGLDGVDMLVVIPKTQAMKMMCLAYAITVHRSQGSEFDTVIFPIVRSQGRMRQRNLFYTAVTRAKKKCWLVGDPTSVQVAIGNDKVVNRNTAFGRAVSEAIQTEAV